ncbi:MAG: hypothetical protein QG555_711 [Thermodesulfobacteriota bacterium]|nr:hypothetical protein [Thermodesulfobacteriota bacterium]
MISLLSCFMFGCAAKTGTQVAKVYQQPDLAKPGSYQLGFLLDGQNTLNDYLEREIARNPELKGFKASELSKLFRNAYPQLYLPVQPGIPLCNLETNFRHCRGIELLADFEIYNDNFVVLHHSVYYRIKLRLGGNHVNFFRAAKAQRDLGEFALPRRYYVGSLVNTIQKALPILQEIATDYSKYIKNDRQEIEIDLTLEESREKASAKKTAQDLSQAAHLSSKAIVISILPSISFVTGLTVSALTSGGKTFWEVLKEEKSFDLHKRTLALDQVDFSYTESTKRNFSRTFSGFFEPLSDMYIREITIRLCQKAPRPSSLSENAVGMQ